MIYYRLCVVIALHYLSQTNAATDDENSNVCIQGVDAVGAIVQLVEYRTRNQEVAGSTHTRSTARNLEQVANLLCAQANSASYPQWDGK